MALTQEFARDAAIYEFAYATGTGPYTLAGAIGAFLPFSESQYAGGGVVRYQATDDSANMEMVEGTYTPGAPGSETLSRDTILDSTNGGAPINWSGRTRVLIHLLVPEFPICPTPPTNGQLLAWDAAEQEWCPVNPFPLCPTPPTNGQVLEWNAAEQEWCPADLPAGGCAVVVNVDSGTAYTATQADLMVVWNSTTTGDKHTTIPAANATIGGQSIDGCVIDIRTTPGDGSRHCVNPASGTIAYASVVAFLDFQCDLGLRANAAKNNWEIIYFGCSQVTPESAPSGPLSLGTLNWSRTVVEKAGPIPPYGQPQVSSNTGGVTITTTVPSYIVLIVTSSLAHSGLGAPTVSSVSASGVTFTHQYSATGSGLNGFYGSWDGVVEIWGAAVPTPVSGLTINVTHTANFQSAVYAVIALSGVDLSSPWDPSGFFSNVGLISPIAVPGVSTTDSPDFVFFWVSNFTNPVAQNDLFPTVTLPFFSSLGAFQLSGGSANAAILVGGSNALGDWNYGSGFYGIAPAPLSNVTVEGNVGSLDAAIAVVGALRSSTSGGPITCDSVTLLTCGCDGEAAPGTVVANITGSTSEPVAVPLNSVLDSQFGSQAGTLIQSDGGPWIALLPGYPGQVLTSQGANESLIWANPTSISVDPIDISLASGASMDWGRLGDVVSGTSDWGRIDPTSDPISLQEALGRLSD